MQRFDSFEDLHAQLQKPLEDVSGHSSDQYELLHDALLNHLGKIGSCMDEGLADGPEGEDFILNREVGDSSPIGVVVEEPIPRTIAATRAALSEIEADYAVFLDPPEAGVIVSKTAGIGFSCDDEDGETQVLGIR